MVLLGLASPAFADELRDLCPNRPGLGTPPCIVDKGHLLAETGLVDWTLTRGSGEREDEILAGDLVARYGLDTKTELIVGWTAYGHVRSRDDSGVEAMSGVGDMTLGFKRSLRNPDGSGLSISLQPTLSLPTGGAAIGAGDWGAAISAPVSFDLGGTVQFGLTPEVDAAVDMDRHGRHLAYGLVTGFDVALTDHLTAALEADFLRDEDPSGAQNQWYGGASLAWQLGENWQIDAGTVLPIDTGSRGVELYFGFARRF